MIDTDKYENHDMIRIAKQLLIEDAPLLLEEVKRLQKVEALAEKRLEFIQRLMSENESMRSDLFWLTNTMDHLQTMDTNLLKQRAVHPSIADFVQSLAEWGFNHVHHGFLWEAMVSVIEAGERGDLDDLIEEQDSLLKAASNDEGEEE